MTHNTIPLPEPSTVTVLHGVAYYTADQMHAYAAKVCAEKDVEIERLWAEWKKVSHEKGLVRAQNRDLRTAAQQALEALEWYVKEDDVIENMDGNEFWVDAKRTAEKSITDLRAALAERDAANLELAKLASDWMDIATAKDAEIERLRDALGRISRSEASYALADFARAALKETK